MARELKMSVREMLSRMDSEELTEWAIFFKLENEEWKKKRANPAGNTQPSAQEVAKKIEMYFTK